MNKTVVIIFNVLILVFLIDTLGGINGILGFVGFTLVLAFYRMWVGRKQMMGIIDMGANQLHALNKLYKDGKKNEKTNKNKHK